MIVGGRVKGSGWISRANGKAYIALLKYDVTRGELMRRAKLGDKSAANILMIVWGLRITTNRELNSAIN